MLEEHKSKNSPACNSPPSHARAIYWQKTVYYHLGKILVLTCQKHRYRLKQAGGEGPLGRGYKTY